MTHEEIRENFDFMNSSNNEILDKLLNNYSKTELGMYVALLLKKEEEEYYEWKNQTEIDFNYDESI